MRAYSVVYKEHKDGAEKVHATFIGSEAEAKTFRVELMKVEGLKRKDVEISLVEIPTTKPELLAWLNAELKKA